MANHRDFSLRYVALGFFCVAVWLPRPLGAVIFTTYVTGHSPVHVPDDVIFRVDFNPAVAGSGAVSVAVQEFRGLGLDGIDYVPGTGDAEVIVGAKRRSPTPPAPPDNGTISRYNVNTGVTLLPDYIPLTNSIGPPAASPPASDPASMLATPSHFYYTENQFGFASPSGTHRIIRNTYTPGGGGEELVLDGGTVGSVLIGGVPTGVGGLENFEGLEIVDVGGGPRLYFFAFDPTPAAVDTRALMSIGLTGGVWDGLDPIVHIAGLAEAIGPGIDGSDELDFDPTRGLLFGTNIFNGEVIAYDPFGMFEVIPGVGGSLSHFIDGPGPGLPPPPPTLFDLDYLAFEVDGIRALPTGQLIFAGRGGVIGAIDVDGVLADGADDADVYALFFDPTRTFDDLTPVTIVIPEPSSLLLCLLGFGYIVRRRRRR